MTSVGQVESADTAFKLVEQFAEGKSLDFRLQSLALPSGPILRFIDCYGDTLLNELQVRALVAELREARGRTAELDLIAHIDALIGFAGRDMPPHSFLWFMGD